ncbi:MAG: hypothetical protein IPJ84_19210 [Bdellovibrionales bacterium]|nr:hypothetical protein [Bdellovibrionales bacterium]MBK7892900.1 hypothetical protein [Bdellovibrionales bacterium]
MKPKWYYCPTWRQNFYFFIGWKPADFEKYVLKTYGHSANIGAAKGRALVMDRGDESRYLIWTISKDASIVAHECLHVTNWMLSERGYKFDPMNDEPHAYLLGALMREALK